MNWIKVSDRLPSKPERVLVVEERKDPLGISPLVRYITTAYQFGHRLAWFNWETDRRITVTHWAPLPELPE